MEGCWETSDAERSEKEEYTVQLGGYKSFTKVV
jgi:hypothetical protein